MKYPGHRPLENLSTNDSFECFHKYLLETIDKHAPIKTIKIKKKSQIVYLGYQIISSDVSTRIKILYKTSLTSKSDKQCICDLQGIQQSFG